MVQPATAVQLEDSIGDGAGEPEPIPKCVPSRRFIVRLVSEQCPKICEAASLFRLCRLWGQGEDEAVCR